MFARRDNAGRCLETACHIEGLRLFKDDLLAKGSALLGANTKFNKCGLTDGIKDPFL